MRIRKSLWKWVVGLLLAGPAFGQSVQTIDLRPFVGPSPFDFNDAEWLLPRGRQTFDGVPFQIDGAMYFYALSPSQRAHPGEAKITDIPVKAKVERLHLLAAVDSTVPDGVIFAEVRFQYADGTNEVVDLRYGQQMRNWVGSRHKTDKDLTDGSAREVWQAENSFAAQSDGYLRLFHCTLTNPSPEKEVRALSVVSAKKQTGLMVAAMSFESAKTDATTNAQGTVTNKFPDLVERNGDPAGVLGIVKSRDGAPLSGVLVRVMATRKFNTRDQNATVNDAAVGTETRTGPDGKFALPPLPDDRLYRLVATVDGFETTLYPGADPKSESTEIRLNRAGAVTIAKFAVRGRLVGPDEKPVAWATVELDGIGDDMGGSSWGGQHGFPERVLTGTNGDFVFSRDEPFARLQLKINSPGLAPEQTWLDVTNLEQTVKMGIGAVIRGRILKDGKPLAKMRMGISGSDRNSMVYAGSYETRTDEDGVFTFKQVPPGTSWNLAGFIGSLKPYGAVPARVVASAGHGQVTDVGDLEVIPGLRLAGKVETHDGQPLPKGFKIRVSYNNGSDSEVASVDADGQFSVSGLYKGQVQVYPEARDWRLSPINRNMELWNGGMWLAGTLEGDKTNLLVVIEKGGRRNFNGSGNNGYLPTQDQPENRPLMGAEPGAAGLVVGGQVVDDKTGQPVALAKVTPGRLPPGAIVPAAQKTALQRIVQPLAKKTVPFNQRPFFEYSRQEALTNGHFSVEFVQMTSDPMLLVEAEGYEPVQTDALTKPETNLVIRLKRGMGPNGVVLLPNGKPAEKATVVYAAKQDQFGLTGRTLNIYGRREDQEQVTGPDGKFSFSARPEGVTLFVSHPDGWAEESVEQGGDGLKLKLRPWASVSGILVNSNGIPMAGVPLNVTMYNDWQQGGALVNLQGSTSSDATGHFLFRDIPPRRIEIQRIIPMGTGGGWSSQLQTWTVLDPGITNDLGKVTYDTPPPPSMMDRMKKSLGY